jgi:hypothetical protein
MVMKCETPPQTVARLRRLIESLSCGIDKLALSLIQVTDVVCLESFFREIKPTETYRKITKSKTVITPIRPHPNITPKKNSFRDIIPKATSRKAPKEIRRMQKVLNTPEHARSF